MILHECYKPKGNGKTPEQVPTLQSGIASNSASVPCSLIDYIGDRKKHLNAEYERHPNCKQMQSIVAGQLLELEKLERNFLANADVWDHDESKKEIQ
jgi:hypothetical protein